MAVEIREALGGRWDGFVTAPQGGAHAEVLAAALGQPSREEALRILGAQLEAWNAGVRQATKDAALEELEAERPVPCNQCTVLTINGHACHETGCPNSWIDPVTQRGYVRSCKECGSDFEPEVRDQRFCDDECGRAWMGQP